MTRARNIATHINHSPSACSLLQSIQKDLGLPCHKMVQDMPTRWNSSYLMLERLYEQRRAISAIAPEINLTILSNNEWNILGSLVSLLKPFEELTKKISFNRCTIADVLPSVAMLRRYLEKDAGAHNGVKTLKSELLRSLNIRFAAIEKWQLRKSTMKITQNSDHAKVKNDKFFFEKISAHVRAWCGQEVKAEYELRVSH